MTQTLEELLQDQVIRSLNVRSKAGINNPLTACRLFNGFSESQADMVIDQYADTLVILNYANPPEDLASIIPGVQSVILKLLPEIQCVLLKTRYSPDQEVRRGGITYGKHPATEIQENSVRYAIDLLLNQDASFYLDTRNLRFWLKMHSKGWKVLNCFAYTGSLGAAALAGGALRVCQLDLSRKFLNIARRTYELNHFQVRDEDFVSGEFFRVSGGLRKKGTQFDCVILDAPFFSSIKGSVLHTHQDSARLINKVRPLVRDGGYIVSINNSLYLTGKDYIQTIEDLQKDGFLQLVDMIAVPEDVTGYPQTILRNPPLNPSPFNHSTKIAVLQIRKK